MIKRAAIIFCSLLLSWTAVQAQAPSNQFTTAPAPETNLSGNPATSTTTSAPQKTESPLTSLGTFSALNGANGAFGDVEITADGETRFEEGVAIAEDNVQIHYKDVSLYADYAEYNPETRDILLKGNVRIYAQKNAMFGQRAIYNLESKQARALEFEGARYPGFFHALGMRSPSANEFRMRDVSITTQDSSLPYWHVHARSTRIYPNDRVIMSGATLYVGKIPIMYLPYLYADLNHGGIQIVPGYDSQWGAFLLTGYTFPIGSGDHFVGTARFDYREKHGPAIGFDLTMKYGKKDRSTGDLIVYYARDKNPGLGFAGSGETPTNAGNNRGRVTFQQQLYLTEDIYVTADINYLSDRNFLEDYYPAEFRIDPQPDNYVQIMKWNEFYTMSLLTRFQMNTFQEVTERLPEAAWDFKQHGIFGSPIYYDGSTTVGYLERAFSQDPTLNPSAFSNYSAARFDTFNQLSYPRNYFGWLNLIPAAGIRGTYYSQSGSFLNVDGTKNSSPTENLQLGGPIFRPVFNANFEASFKVSRAFEQIQSRALGVDGVRHIMQPYTDFSYVYNAGPKPDDVLQFDNNVPSTQPQALTFPQFTGIDSLDTWAIWRAGVRNRFQTRRNNDTLSWFFDDTYVDYNFQNPYTNQKIGNLVNQMAFYPVPWFGLRLDTQVPITNDGFSEANMTFNYMPVKNLALSIGDQYINNNPYFPNGNQVNFGAYWRMNDNWAFSFAEQYQAVENFLAYQRYSIYRDLSSWIVSFGAEVRTNQGQAPQYGVVLTFTLKDAPQIYMPTSIDPGLGSSGSN